MIWLKRVCWIIGLPFYLIFAIPVVILCIIQAIETKDIHLSYDIFMLLLKENEWPK